MLIKAGINPQQRVSIHEGLEPLTPPLIHRCLALSYFLYCLRLRGSSQISTQIFDLLSGVSLSQAFFKNSDFRMNGPWSVLQSTSWSPLS